MVHTVKTKDEWVVFRQLMSNNFSSCTLHACWKKVKDKASKQAHRLDASLSSDEEYTMYTIRNRTTKPFEVKLELNGVGTTMEVDTGASVSIVSENRFKMLQEKGTTLRPSRAKLFTYTGEAINVVGVTDVTVKHNGQSPTNCDWQHGTLITQTRLASSLKVGLEGDFCGTRTTVPAGRAGRPQGGICRRPRNGQRCHSSHPC